MTGVVEFNVDEFRELTPEFDDKDKFTDAMLKSSFGFSTYLLNNTKGSVVKDLDERKTLLYLLTAHNAKINDNDKSGSGGIVASASEGSTSVSFSTVAVDKRNAWYMSTIYGQLYWQLTQKYRGFQHVTASVVPSVEGTNGRWRQVFERFKR